MSSNHSKPNKKGFTHLALSNSKQPSSIVQSDSLANAFAQVFGPVDHQFIADGLIHRLDDPTGRPGNQACWYVLYPQPCSFAVFGSWRYGQNYYTDLRKLDFKNVKPFRKLLIEQCKKQQVDTAVRNELAALAAQSIWGTAQPASADHAYLVKKHLPTFDLRTLNNELLIPLYHDDKLVNLQRILPTGAKRFLKNGKVKGSYYRFGDITDAPKMMLCEGWATGATLHQWYGMPVFCAMSAMNLKPVALAITAIYPKVELIICSDDDRKTSGNPGMYYAQQAQKAVGCSMFMPKWPEDAPLDLTDFSDLYLWLLQHGGIE
jgi:putative DNA primase/helicase